MDFLETNDVWRPADAYELGRMNAEENILDMHALLYDFHETNHTAQLRLITREISRHRRALEHVLHVDLTTVRGFAKHHPVYSPKRTTFAEGALVTEVAVELAESGPVELFVSIMNLSHFSKRELVTCFQFAGPGPQGITLPSDEEWEERHILQRRPQIEWQ